MPVKISAAIFALVGGAIVQAQSDCGSGRIHIDIRSADSYCLEHSDCSWNVRI